MRISDWSSDVCSSDLQAIMRGGALSIFGDFLFSDTTQYGNSLLGTVAGPVAGLAEDVAALTLGNIHQAARGEDTHVGAELVRFTRSNMPLANLWYTKAATDHLVFHQFQEFFSPGYLRSEEHTSELQSLMRISYAVFCLKKKKQHQTK